MGEDSFEEVGDRMVEEAHLLQKPLSVYIYLSIYLSTYLSLYIYMDIYGYMYTF